MSTLSLTHQEASSRAPESPLETRQAEPGKGPQQRRACRPLPSSALGAAVVLILPTRPVGPSGHTEFLVTLYPAVKSNGMYNLWRMKPFSLVLYKAWEISQDSGRKA